MSEPRVWAPDAHSVQLRVRDELLDLGPADGGWWRADRDVLHPGEDYSFILNDGDPLPDPRSAWQPEGVYGPSRMVDHAAFSWTDRGWQPPPLSSAVIYELHIGTFTEGGSFDSAIARLNDLVALGITHVELMPVAEFSGDWGWGYDGVDLFAPHHAYGGPAGLKRLVDACHSRGLAVLLDVVYNHLGPVGNFLGRFGPYFTEKYSTPWGPAVNLDGPGSVEVRRFFCDNAAMWLRDYHCDGLRVDAVHAMFDSSATHFLGQLADEVDALEAHLGRHLVLIAESDWNDPRVVLPREAGGLGIDAQWSDDFHHALHTVLTGERSGYYRDFGSLADLAKALTSAFVYDGCYSRYRDRVHGAPPVHASGAHFLGYIQTHDQIGNRARGERISHLVGEGKARIAAALVLLGPFIPLLFQGEEFGASSPFQYFTQHDDPEVARAVTEGRRREFAKFGWNPEQIPDPQDARTFERAKLRWSEREREPHAGMLAWHRELIVLRRALPELAAGRLDQVSVQFNEQERWLVMRRGPVFVVCNFSAQQRRIPVGGSMLDSQSESVMVIVDSKIPETSAHSEILTRDTPNTITPFQ